MAPVKRHCSGCKADLSAKPYGKGKRLRLPAFTVVHIAHYPGEGAAPKSKALHLCPACARVEAMPIINDLIAEFLTT